MVFVLSCLYGYDVTDAEGFKKELYKKVQTLAGSFKEQCGSIVCREILKNPPSDPNPTERTAEYYKTRPCALMVKTAAELLDEFIAANPIEN